jgi:hypothetical protein
MGLIARSARRGGLGRFCNGLAIVQRAYARQMLAHAGVRNEQGYELLQRREDFKVPVMKAVEQVLGKSK